MLSNPASQSSVPTQRAGSWRASSRELKLHLTSACPDILPRLPALIIFAHHTHSTSVISVLLVMYLTRSSGNMSALRTLSTRLPRATSTTTARSFSVFARTMAEGDTGSARSGGAAQSDAFTKREKANEDYYVKEQERSKLEALRKKIADNEGQLAKDREEAEKLLKEKK